MTGVFDPSRADVLVTFESSTTSRGSKGGDQQTWSKLKQKYGERERLSGGESIQTNQQVATMPSTYRFRHDTDIVAGLRLFEGIDNPTSPQPRYYVRDVQHWKREGYTRVLAERRDNA